MALFALKRAMKIFFWLRLTGNVLGPVGNLPESAAMLIRYNLPDGQVREFPAPTHFGIGNRKAGEAVQILVHPRNPAHAELMSPMTFAIPGALLLMSAALAFILLN